MEIIASLLRRRLSENSTPKETPENFGEDLTDLGPVRFGTHRCVPSPSSLPARGPLSRPKEDQTMLTRPQPSMG